MTINSGGTLQLNNTGGNHASNNRLNNLTNIIFNGGTLAVLGATSLPSSETVTSASVAAGHSRIFSQAGSGGTTNILFDTMDREPGASILFESASGQTFGVDNSVSIGVAPAGFLNGIVPYGMVLDSTTSVTIGGGAASNASGFNMATWSGAGQEILAFTTYDALDPTGAATLPEHNVLVIATPGAALVSQTFNSLLVVGTNVTISGAAASTLTLDSGLIASSGSGITMSVPTLQLNTNVDTTGGVILMNTGSLTINSIIEGIGGVAIGGAAGTLTLNADSTYSGEVQSGLDTNATNPAPTWTWLNSGTLVLGSANALPTVAIATQAGVL